MKKTISFNPHNITNVYMLEICIINKTLNFHYRKRTRGGAEHSYRITQNIIVRDQVERQVPGSPSIRFSSLARANKIYHPHYIRENLPLSLPRRSFRTYPFSPLLTSDYRLPRASFRTCATRSGTSARSR